MPAIKGIKNISIFATMFLLIISNAKVFVKLGIDSYWEYGAYLLLLCGVAVCFLVARRPVRHKIRQLIVFALVSALFCIGIAVQPLDLGIRLRLMAAMLVIPVPAILGDDYLCSLESIRAAAYGIMAGTVMTTIISLIAGVSVLETVHEGLLPYGFTGGVQYKNFYAAFLLGSFMGLFFYDRYVRRCWLDRIVMALQVVLLLFSSARGTYIFFAAFLVLSYLPTLAGFLMRFRFCRNALVFWKSLKKPYRILLTALAVLIALLLVILAFGLLVSVSETYAIRYRGVVQYWHYAKQRPFRVIFGNAAQVWADPSVDYVSALRALVGKHTSFEMAFLNTFIKNGVLGLIGFAVMFTYLAIVACKVGTRQGKRMIFVIMFVLLLSSLVESFATNIHSIFGIVCYLYMSGLTGMCRHEQKE